MRLVTPLLLLFLATPVGADGLPVVIDTDAGLDDAVALAIALQQTRLDIRAIVVTEGVASGQRGLEFVDRLLTYFGRKNIPLYGPARRIKKIPSFRAGAEATLHRLLPAKKAVPRLAFSPGAYCRGCTLLALGPLTSFAAAIAKEPGLKIKRVIFRGSVAPASWNVRFDPSAIAPVRATKIPVSFLRDAASTRKSSRWLAALLRNKASNAPALRLFRTLFATASVRDHYLKTLPHFTDEVGLLALLAPRTVRHRRSPTKWGFGKESHLVFGRSHRRVLYQLTHFVTDGK